MSKKTKRRTEPARNKKPAVRKARTLVLAPPRLRRPRQRRTAFAAGDTRPAVPARTGVIVRLAQLKHAAGLSLPAYQSAGAAGLDLLAAVPAKKPIRLAARARALVPTGLVIELPAGFEAQVRPRSGLALKHGVTVLNSPGTIDSDYRGEIQVILVNLGTTPFTIERGERIAQMVIAPAAQVRIAAVGPRDLSSTLRGSGGFGSTGTSAEARRQPGAQKKKQTASKSSPAKKSTSRRRAR